ncbi:MAG: hypothetical protein MR378_03240 [Ruminococcus sp.]|nr:hypothetical protein [Ruminococcus sp.]
MALESPFKGMGTANVVCLGLINKILAAENEPQAIKSFLIQQFFKNAGEVQGE